MAQKEFVLKRVLQRRVSRKTLQANVDAMVARILKSPLGEGWKLEFLTVVGPFSEEDGTLVYKALLLFETVRREKALTDKWPLILSQLSEAACSGPNKREPWEVLCPRFKGRVPAQSKQRM